MGEYISATILTKCPHCEKLTYLEFEEDATVTNECESCDGEIEVYCTFDVSKGKPRAGTDVHGDEK